MNRKKKLISLQSYMWRHSYTCTAHIRVTYEIQAIAFYWITKYSAALVCDQVFEQLLSIICHYYFNYLHLIIAIFCRHICIHKLHMPSSKFHSKLNCNVDFASFHIRPVLISSLFWRTALSPELLILIIFHFCKWHVDEWCALFGICSAYKLDISEIVLHGAPAYGK